MPRFWLAYGHPTEWLVSHHGSAPWTSCARIGCRFYLVTNPTMTQAIVATTTLLANTSGKSHLRSCHEANAGVAVTTSSELALATASRRRP
jgi:hypothetical protein